MFHDNIVKLAKENNNFRKVLSTNKFSQVVLMSIPLQGEIGEEIHKLDQLFMFVQGTGTAYLNDKQLSIKPEDLVVVPAGTKHNFINTGKEDLKLFTMYAPPAHKPGTIRKTKEEADTIPE